MITWKVANLNLMETVETCELRRSQNLIELLQFDYALNRGSVA